MDQNIVRAPGAEAAAKDALAAVIGDSPLDARTILEATSFRERHLVIAWAEELSRLGQQAQTEYENRERAIWRDTPRPLTPAERDHLAGVVREHLRARVASLGDWTDISDIVLAVAPHTNAHTPVIQDWAREHLQALVRDGVLSRPPQSDGTSYGEYRIVSVPERDKSVSVPVG